MARRCISAECEAQGSVRIQQTCQSTGEAAGVTAAISILEKIMLRELNPQLVVSRLKRIISDVEPSFDILNKIHNCKNVMK